MQGSFWTLLAGGGGVHLNQELVSPCLDHCLSCLTENQARGFRITPEYGSQWGNSMYVNSTANLKFDGPGMQL